ncbi:SPX domain-containing protein [Mycena rebaudengoi]|nr:SPX domain-containing protein [Mycena rebaudengoi]
MLRQTSGTSLVDRGAGADAVFVPLLDGELQKICAFYEAQVKELTDEIIELEESVRQQEEAGLAGNHYLDGPYDDDDDDDDDDESVSRSPQRRRRSSTRAALSASGTISRIPEESPRQAHRYSISSSSSDGHPEPQMPSSPRTTLGRLAGRFSHHFMQSSITSSTHENVWTSRSDYAYDTRLLFKRRITTLYISVTSLKSYVEVNYSGFRKILKKYDKVTYRELKDTYLHTAVEPSIPFTAASRATITALVNRLVELYAKCVTRNDRSMAKQQLRLHQRENIAWERDTVWRQMIGRERRGDGDIVGATGASLLKEEEETNGKPGVVLKLGPLRMRVTKKKIAMILAIVLFVALLNTQSVEGTEANKCFAVLMFCTVGNTIIRDVVDGPFALGVLLRHPLMQRAHPCPRRMRPSISSPVMFSPTIMLLIGGFTISSALSKTNIDRVLITRVLSLAGTRPSTVLLAFMGVSCFASYVDQPILRTLPPKSSFGPCLILAIALAANIGGQSSPISSPQNLIALQAMDPPISWGQWFIVALPARAPDGGRDIEIKWWVTFVCLVTIALWCVARQIENYIGDMGIIAIIPIIAFFATGVLKKDDFEQFAWTIVFLAMGGIALGKGVTSSGLLEVLDTVIRDLLDGVSLYNVVLILSPVVLVISTFISHTIASVLLVPIAKEVGSNLPGNHQNLLIFITGLICSTGMGMPVSGFPNQTAATQEDELGVLYLSNVDFLKNGVPASIIATLVVSSVGFLLMKAIG